MERADAVDSCVVAAGGVRVVVHCGVMGRCRKPERDVSVKSISVFAVLAVGLVWATASPLDAQQKRQSLMVHYMPWYAADPARNQWGWHWTMNHFQPDRRGPQGWRQIASHDYPQIGVYDSNDPLVLECQTLLMKMAAVDGVIIDWYGIEKFRDYAEIHRNTQHLIQHVKRAGLKFAICYEDQSVKHMQEAKQLDDKASLAVGQQALRWLARHWFQDEAYLRIESRPVLLVFGPQHFDRNEWHTLLSDLKPRPHVYGLPHLTQTRGMDGAFGWPPVTGGREVTPGVWRNYLAQLDARPADQGPSMAVAFPGFRDIYQQAGLHASYGWIDERAGKTLAETLALAAQSEARIVQVATWNDYGEGTVVEPTRKYGYRYLEQLARHTKAAAQPQDLRLPIELYQLKKKYGKQAPQATRLVAATDALFAGQYAKARRILAAVRDRAP